jgi:hypothetical protein
MTPTDSPAGVELWAELHVDEHVFPLVKPWNLDGLAAALRAAASQGTQVEVRVYTGFNNETTVLVNPAQARVVYLVKRPRVLAVNGMPDVSDAPAVRAPA